MEQDYTKVTDDSMDPLNICIATEVHKVMAIIEK